MDDDLLLATATPAAVRTAIARRFRRATGPDGAPLTQHPELAVDEAMVYVGQVLEARDARIAALEVPAGVPDGEEER